MRNRLLMKGALGTVALISQKRNVDASVKEEIVSDINACSNAKIYRMNFMTQIYLQIWKIVFLIQRMFVRHEAV